MSTLSRFSAVGVSVVCGVFVLVACSAPPPDQTVANGQDQTATPGSSGSSGSIPKKSSPGDTTTPGTPTPPTTPGADGGTPVPSADMACSTMTADACVSCCEGHHPAGLAVEDNASDACLCGAAGKCQTECAKTDCSADDNAPDSVAGDACDVCENLHWADDGTGDCTAPITAACNGNADCAAMYACEDACP